MESVAACAARRATAGGGKPQQGQRTAARGGGVLAPRLYGKRSGVRSAAISGGVGKPKQGEALRRGVDVVVACPGRLLDLSGERSIDLSQVEGLVLDEADRMCDRGFLPEIRRILKLVPHA